MHKDDLVPLKRVLEHVGVGRVTMWRALNSGLEIPKPTIIRRRVFWRAHEIQNLDQALDSFMGRVAFETRRHQDRVLSELQSCVARQGAARKPRPRRRASAAQLELFPLDIRRSIDRRLLG